MTRFITTLLVALTLLLAPTLCLAQATRPPIIPAGTDETLLLPHTEEPEEGGLTQQQTVIGVILPSATRIIIALAGGLAFLFIIIGGIQILTAYGDDEKLGNAKKTITYAIVGLLISMLSYAIVSIISSISL